MTKWPGGILPAVLLTLAAAACGTGARGADPHGAHPGESPVVVTPEGNLERGDYTEADARFMQGMISHHLQALDMTRLVPGRTHREPIQLLAERIEVSQKDEIAQMRRWLEKRGEAVEDPHHGHHAAAGHAALMPGMLSPEELARLEAARGVDFDRLFLEYMIRHHEGALVMVEQLFAAPGAGQQVEVFRLASDVDADQRMEITRMRRMLDAIAGANPR